MHKFLLFNDGTCKIEMSIKVHTMYKTIKLEIQQNEENQQILIQKTRLA